MELANKQVTRVVSILTWTFGLLPLIAGADKYMHLLTDWHKYLADDFSYKNYTRTHSWRFGGGTEVKASAAPGYFGNPEFVNPEEAFIASLASCHLLTFLAIASFKKYKIESYEDNASGLTEKNAEGKMAVTKVYLRPKIAFSGEKKPDEGELEKMHHKAHAECFIANSVLTEVVLEPQVNGHNTNQETSTPVAGSRSQNMESIEDMKKDELRS